MYFDVTIKFTQMETEEEAIQIARSLNEDPTVIYDEIISAIEVIDLGERRGAARRPIPFEEDENCTD
jgi:hypothetical protein